MSLNEAIHKYFPNDWLIYMLRMDIDYVKEALKELSKHNLHLQINDDHNQIRDKWASDFTGDYEVTNIVKIVNGEIV